jgi:hypothetical protein
LLALSLLIPFPTVLHAAAVIVQSAVDQACGSSPCTINFAGNVTGGNAVIVGAVCINGCSSATFTFSDATNGAYTTHVDQISSSTGRTASVGSKRNLTGGFTGVVTTASGGTTLMEVFQYEVSGLDNGLSVLFGSTETLTATSHPCSGSGLSGTGFALCMGNNNSGPNITATASWTKDSGAATVYLGQRRITTFSGETGTYTTDATTNSVQAMGLWRETAAAGSGGCRAALSLLGVGGC